MSSIGDFLTYYKENYGFYKSLAQRVADQCEMQLKIRGIKAIVSSRAKKPASLNAKIIKLDSIQRLKKVSDIKKKVTDLSGVRIAVYFPGDRKKVEEMINANFKVVKRKNFPEGKHSPGHGKRFSGYWATHYLVTFKDLNKKDKFYNKIVEIQVASVLMHAWAEIEHDLVYKPVNGKISQDELAIIDELNGLMLCGEIALERLKKVMEQRIKQTKSFNDDSELASFIFERLGSDNLGDTKLMSILLSGLSELEIRDVETCLHNTHFDKTKSISSQLLDALLFKYIIERNNPIEKVFEVYNNTGIYEITNIQAYRFLRLWFGLERALYVIKNSYPNFDNYYSGIFHSLEVLKNIPSLKSSRVERLLEASHIRDSLLAGENLYSEDLLKKKSEDLYSDIKKILRDINDDEVRENIYQIVRASYHNCPEIINKAK